MRRRRAVTVFIIGAIVLVALGGTMPRMVEESKFLHSAEQSRTTPSTKLVEESESRVYNVNVTEAQQDLSELPIKGRASKAGYTRTQFGAGWALVDGCSTRNIILYRDLKDVVLENACTVVSGTLVDPYSGKTIQFSKEKSSEVQIDHVVALSDAWQKGAQLLTLEQRKQLANDPLELLAVAGADNQAKGDGDAATWLPKNKAFRCEYVARQVSIKRKYQLWVTEAEGRAMKAVLESCAVPR